MKNDFFPFTTIVTFLWSIWAFYSGNHPLAFYLLGVSIFILLLLCTVYLFSIDTLIDLLEKAVKHQTTENENNNEAVLMRLSNLIDQIQKKG